MDSGLSQLEADRDALLASYAEVVPEALDALSGEGRMRVYEMLQLEVRPDPEGYEVSAGRYVIVGRGTLSFRWYEINRTAFLCPADQG